eukprot:gnl/MRDRNA2_/MRDRNA2_383995_c0_seq1.p1 gnl/MRDRNA2_/MRDRNA2_383995_c0~~gnl/MRDRNA2_/MRDRNA2_383995_c0_seq1.p1  ORF type:complete len:108 (-),score=24.73 gnl/MRDRNA2_/MRDRNA2_383995_c0_seq1:84-407(-)
MRKERILPNAITYNISIAALAKGRCWELALSFLKNCLFLMRHERISYGAAISACGNGGQWQYALALLNMMMKDRVAPDTTCYNSTISACEKAASWKLAVLTLEMCRS